MALNYYDDAIVEKLNSWLPNEAQGTNLRVLKPNETKRLFEMTADDKGDQPFQLPIIALSRDTNIELEQTTKCLKSFNGLAIANDEMKTVQMNVIPIKLSYQLDIFTKDYELGDEYLREYLFKLINNPKFIIEIPYNDVHIQHVANIRIQPTVADTSEISERIFPGQFTRWTINFIVQDAFLFSVPYRRNWKFKMVELEVYNDIKYEDKVEDQTFMIFDDEIKKTED